MNLEKQQVETEIAQGRIIDADVAVEVSEMTRQQIIQRSGASMLNQVKNLGVDSLRLLRNSFI